MHEKFYAASDEGPPVREDEFIGCPNDIVMLVLNSKDKPSSRFVPQIRFVAEGREIPTQIVEVKTVTGRLELYPFCLIGQVSKSIELVL